jgi:hypothetical protein
MSLEVLEQRILQQRCKNSTGRLKISCRVPTRNISAEQIIIEERFNSKWET